MGIFDLITFKVIEMGVWFYWLALSVSFFESLAFVGILIPGTTLIIFIGFIGTLGLFDMGDMTVFVAAGAILGDLASYYLGTKGTHFFKKEAVLLKRSHLYRGESFFKKHGGKSIFLARFIGPIRSIIPFVAGLSQMRLYSFLVWNVIGGIFSSAVFLSLGYFFGELWDVARIWFHRVEWALLGLLILIFAVHYFSENFSWGMRDSERDDGGKER